MTKQVIFDNEVREKILKGADRVVKAVGVTIGPRGQNVALASGFGSPRITNDGVSIAKDISLKDPFENMGAEVVKEVASKTNDIAGDGTSTAIVLTGAILKEGLKKTSMGANPVMVKKGIEAAAADAVEELKKISKKVKTDDDIKAVASISAESEELGETIANTIKSVGKDGVVTVEESQSIGISSEVVDGMEFNQGYLSPYMVTNPEKMIGEIKNPAVLLVDGKLSSMKDILPLLEEMAQSGKKDLFLVAEDVDGEVLATFILNKLRGSFNVLAVKTPGFGDEKKNYLEDIAVLTGATVVSEEVGLKLEEARLDVLGTAERVVASKDKTTIINGGGLKKQIEERISQLKKMAENLDSDYEREKILKRVAKLSGGVAVIRVGAATETEMKYLKDKIDDAVNATKAAIDEGIVPGGGSTLVKISDKLLKSKPELVKAVDEFSVGYKILAKALRAPFKKIVENSGRDNAEVLIRDIIKSGVGFGFDANSDGDEDKIIDMFKAGIIDPTKVERAGIENAASAAATLLTTRAAVADEPEEKEKEMPNPGMMM